MTSLYNIAQQVVLKTGKGYWQEVIQDVREAYASAVKQIWYENKKMNIGELDGAFIIPFTEQTPLLDDTTCKYYLDLTSSYVQLPQEGGLVSVSYMSAPDVNFVLVNAGTYGRLKNIKAGLMGGRQIYYAENAKLWFPRMTDTTNMPLIVRLGLAIDDYDVDKPINVPNNVQEQIVQMCVQKYVTPPTETPINKAIK